jgi:hypothetical protein
MSDKKTIFEPVTDVDAARELRSTVERHLLEIIATANKAKIDAGLNVYFMLHKSADGVFESAKINITKDM